MSKKLSNYLLFHDECPYHIEANQLICKGNQWAGFHMIETSVMKKLKDCRIVNDSPEQHCR